jgi:hypothetical protein
LILHSIIVLFLRANCEYLALARNRVDHNTVLRSLVIPACLIAIGGLQFDVK